MNVDSKIPIIDPYKDKVICKGPYPWIFCVSKTGTPYAFYVHKKKPSMYALIGPCYTQGLRLLIKRQVDSFAIRMGKGDLAPRYIFLKDNEPIALWLPTTPSAQQLEKLLNTYYGYMDGPIVTPGCIIHVPAERATR